MWRDLRKGSWRCVVAVCDARLTGAAGREEKCVANWLLVLRAHMRLARRPFCSRNEPRIVAIVYVGKYGIPLQGAVDIGVVERSLACESVVAVKLKFFF